MSARMGTAIKSTRHPWGTTPAIEMRRHVPEEAGADASLPVLRAPRRRRTAAHGLIHREQSPSRSAPVLIRNGHSLGWWSTDEHPAPRAHLQ